MSRCPERNQNKKQKCDEVNKKIMTTALNVNKQYKSFIKREKSTRKIWKVDRKDEIK